MWVVRKVVDAKMLAFGVGVGGIIWGPYEYSYL